jgi:serine/threonine protein kinase
VQNDQERPTQTGRLDRRTVLNSRYMILQTVGQGGMGAVYKAQDMKRRSIVAVKEMSLSMVPPDEQERALRNFETEARMLGALHHPNLPAFTGRFTDADRHFLVMEFIDGQTLEALLERNNGPFSERRVLGWARQLCDVLAYLHSQPRPIIFRDLKPGNIMVTRDGRIKLIDFGIARFFRHASSADTQVLGTPGYAPPEQYGKAQTDNRSDIYSLAMTLFHLMTNTLSEKGFGLKNVNRDFPQISLPVARALEKATALAPEERFQTVDAFRRALLGEGTFLFENGEQATSPEELAELCARFPEEAAEYLFSGEIEAWIQDIDNAALQRAVRRIRENESDPLRAIEALLQAIMGPNARIRRLATKNEDAASATSSSRGWFQRAPAASIMVQPLIIDFGDVYPGLSEPMSLAITGRKGVFIQGSLAPTEPWIIIDKASFEGMNTRVSVRVDTTGLFESRRYSGSIVIMPEAADDAQDLKVAVQVSVIGSNGSSAYATRPVPGAGLPVDLDRTITNGTGKAAMAPQVSASAAQTSVPPAEAPVPASAASSSGLNYNKARYNEYRNKYGPPGSGGDKGGGAWNGMQMSARQRFWLRQGLTALAAFMLSSLVYLLLAHVLPGGGASLSSTDPWLIVALLAAFPAAALGSFLPNWQWKLAAMSNRLSTALSTAFLGMTLSAALWHLLLGLGNSPVQLFLVLLVTAIGATIGIHATGSQQILRWMRRFLNPYLTRLTTILSCVIGGLLGLLMALSYTFSVLTFLAILVGIGVALALITQAKASSGQRATP